MSKFDSFFTEKAPESLNKKIIERAAIELAQLKKKDRQKKWMSIWLPLAPVFAIAVFAVYMNFSYIKQKVNEGEYSVEATLLASIGSDEATQLIEDDEALEIVDDLGLLEQMDTLTEISEEDLEG